jgi:hypothetical protein
MQIRIGSTNTNIPCRIVSKHNKCRLMYAHTYKHVHHTAIYTRTHTHTQTCMVTCCSRILCSLTATSPNATPSSILLAWKTTFKKMQWENVTNRQTHYQTKRSIHICLKIFTLTFNDVSEIFKFHFKIFIWFLNCVTSSVAPSGVSKKKIRVQMGGHLR